LRVQKQDLLQQSFLQTRELAEGEDGLGESSKAFQFQLSFFKRKRQGKHSSSPRGVSGLEQTSSVDKNQKAVEERNKSAIIIYVLYFKLILLQRG
jgi:hypothetical protein